jgi:DNA-binding NtrC family response regulator
MDVVEATGCEAIGASNADEALSVLEARPDIRIVFTDIQIPGSMDGLGLVRLMQTRWPRVAVLVASGKTDITDLPTGVQFLAKPYGSLQIETALRQLVGDLEIDD